jgi:rhodanese-related sulfurtransferase
VTPVERRSIDAVLTDARANLDRLGPRDAYEAVRRGAVLVDIRPLTNREIEGGVPGALVIDRNILEWRLDPTSDARIADANYDLHVVLMCNEGYASSLAASGLHVIGLHRATDVIGGYRAWRAAGLPTTPPRSTASDS